MSGRDIMALAAGLYECQNFDYLDQRVKQCEYLAQGFYKAGVKGVVLPAGGHGVYINMDEFFDNKRAPEICRCAISTPSLRPIRTNNENSGERQVSLPLVISCTAPAQPVRFLC